MQRFVPSLAALLALPIVAAAATPPPAVHNPAKHTAQAQSINKLGGAQGWEAYVDAAHGAKICYLIGKPGKSEPAKIKRGPVFASVTHRPAEKRFNEVSFTSGYLFKDGSDAELSIDGKKFSLFTNKDGAWTRDAATDKAVVEALAKGKQATIKGTSARGTATTDTYSLAGFSKALEDVDKACGVKR
ncbi:MAG TPA: invasion associated locus B family protein [Stellaceae bacterium]|nr:invasion associated locus B family protein [Stellaceae bacterium]